MESDMKKNEGSAIKLQKLFFSNLLLLFLCVLLISPWLCSRTLAADDDILLSQEERQQLADMYNTLKDTTKQSQTKLKKYSEKWTQIKEKYGNAQYPSILKLINKMEGAGVTHKLNTALKGLGKVEQGLNQIDSAAGKIQPYVNFYNRYKPDSENPMRPLEQISNLLEDLNLQIKKYDPSGGIVTKPIRAIIEFYQKAASSFVSGLTRLQEKINERRGGCIGEGAGWFSSKDKKFIDLKTGDTICPYSGIKLDRAEIWVDIGGDGNVYIWWNNQWKKIKPGIGCVEEVNRGWLLAFGEKVSTENLISRCNTNWKKVLEAKKLGTRHYNSLFSGEECVKKILKHKKLKLERLGMEEFIAKYMFRADFKRKIDRIIRTVENTVLVMGTVEEEVWPHKSISGARIKASGGGASAQCQSEPGGWFTLVFDLKPDSDERRIAKVTVTHNDYETYKGEKRLWKQCEDSWYGIRLEQKKKDDGTDSTSDDQSSGGSAGDDDSNGSGEDDDSRCGANEIKNESGDCVCRPGFEKVNGVCKLKCGENQNRNESGDCVCADGFEKIDGKCVAKCKANEVRNDAGVCVCKPGYERDANNECAPKCKENEVRNDAGVCVCKPGFEKVDGKCVDPDPFDSKYSGFTDILAQRGDDRSQNLADQVTTDQGTRKGDKFTSTDNLDKDLVGIHGDIKKCKDNSQCPTGFICQKGVCVEKPDKCTQNSDCPSGQECRHGECVTKPVCSKNTDCPKGQTCKNGQCVAAPVQKAALSVSPANKAVVINETVNLKTTYTNTDGSTKDVTAEARWSPSSTFSRGAIGVYTVTASHKGLSASSQITVVQEKGMDDITVNQKIVTVTFWDSGKLQDGDMIDILINGEVVFPGITLTFAKQSRTITMNADIIVVEFKALNEGTAPPNTASISFSAVTAGKDTQTYSLKKNQSANMNMNYKP